MPPPCFHHSCLSCLALVRQSAGQVPVPTRVPRRFTPHGGCWAHKHLAEKQAPELGKWEWRDKRVCSQGIYELYSMGINCLFVTEVEGQEGV